MRPVIKALTKDQSDRSKVENDLLLNYFKKLGCFADLKISNSDLLRNIASIECFWLPKHEVLFRIGDRGRNFYIQLSGRSQLFIQNPEIAALKELIKDDEEKITTL